MPGVARSAGSGGASGRVRRRPDRGALVFGGERGEEQFLKCLPASGREGQIADQLQAEALTQRLECGAIEIAVQPVAAEFDAGGLLLGRQLQRAGWVLSASAASMSRRSGLRRLRLGGAMSSTMPPPMVCGPRRRAG